MAVRDCDQCGAVFELRREHARFCSARCRIAWNREHAGQRVPDAALGWSLTAMSETTRRLASISTAGRPAGLAAISEAVWLVTIVDATMIRCGRCNIPRSPVRA